MASYSACLGPELAERFKTAAAQCYFGANEGEDEDEEEVSEEVIEDRQRPPKGKGKKGKGKRGKRGRRRPGKGRPAEESSEEETEDDEVFDVVDFVRGDVEERTCVYRQLGWVCEESGQVNQDAMRADISSAFMTSDFDWRSAILTCEAVKFPMLCSLTERVQEDLDIAGFDVDLDMVIQRLGEEERRELGRIATPLGFFNCAMAAFHAGCKATVEDMLEGASSHHEEGR